MFSRIIGTLKEMEEEIKRLEEATENGWYPPEYVMEAWGEFLILKKQIENLGLNPEGVYEIVINYY